MVFFTWKEIVGASVALLVGLIALMQLPMFKTERQKRDELLTPEQRQKMAVMETICRGETPVGVDKQIYPPDPNAACLIARRSREIIGKLK